MAHAGSRLKPTDCLDRHRFESQPSSRTGENPPYGMIGGIEETSASFEVRSAPRSYPTPISGPPALLNLAETSRPKIPLLMRYYLWVPACYKSIFQYGNICHARRTTKSDGPGGGCLSRHPPDIGRRGDLRGSVCLENNRRR